MGAGAGIGAATVFAFSPHFCICVVTFQVCRGPVTPPDRETAIGKMLNAYLTNAAEVDDRAIHLLFSANRWEKAAHIKRLLLSGVNVIVDR